MPYLMVETQPFFDGSPAGGVADELEAIAERVGKKAGMPMAGAFHVRRQGILENIRGLIGGLSV